MMKKRLGLINGIILGDTEQINKDILNNFRICGLAHVLAVSGTHISYIILGVNFLFKYVNISKSKKRALQASILIIFMCLVGDSASVIRAVIMSVMLILSDIFYKKADTINCMNVSAIIELLYNPYFIIDIGFLLSYGGVIGIVIFNKILNKIFKNYFEKNRLFKYIKKVVLICLSVQIVILPVSIYNFNQISSMFLISNIIILPIIGVLIIFNIVLILISLFSIELASIFKFISSFLVDIIIYMVNNIVKIPYSNIIVKTPNILMIINYYLIIIIIYIWIMHSYGFFNILKNNYKLILKKIIILILIISIILKLINISNNQNLRIFFIDVGQRGCLFDNYSKE